jgi:hypothetical protein
MSDGEEMSRKALRDAILDVAGDRLNASIAGKVIRNAASSWTQSGHLARIMHQRPEVPALAL